MPNVSFGILDVNFWQAVVLGLVQGLTEFLPVSSSGHLAIFGSMFGKIDGGIAFEVLLHLATLIAVLYVYRKRIKTIDYKYIVLLVIASIPAGLVGFFFSEVIKKAFGAPIIIGIAFVFTGTILYLISRLPEGSKQKVGYKEALGMGLAQAIAVLPGVSRSGMTLSAGLLLGLKREEAAAFSFLMSVPVIAGAGLLEFKDLLEIGSIGGGIYLAIGFVAAVLTGILAIKLVQLLLKTDNFRYFSYYLWSLGILTVILSLV